MDLGLAGKVALVTGSSRGIGLATARALAAEGCRVMLCARTAVTLETALVTLRACGVEASSVVADVSTAAGASLAVSKTIDCLGGIDILINNVGGSLGTGTFDSIDDAAWSEVVRLNLDSAVHCSRRAVEWMKAHGGGSIVHVSSVWGREYGPSAAYVAAKGALIALAKEMAVDLAPFGIRVNCVAPGSILFEGGSWDRRIKRDPDAIAAMVKRELPWGRFGAPEEVAAAIAFVCSPKASWVAGACLPIDGAQGRAL